MSDREMEVVRGLAFCPWCSKKVPPGDLNVYQHCAGRSHQRAVGLLQVEHAERIEAAGWGCRLCQVRVSANWSVALQHVAGARHSHLAVEELRQESQQAQQPAVDPEAAAIVRTGQCAVCRKPVARHVDVASQHVDGAAHKLFKTLQSADWKTSVDVLQKGAEGLDLRLQVPNVARQRGDPVVVELGVPLAIDLELHNNSPRNQILRRVLVIPPLKAELLGLTLKLPSSQLVLPASHCCKFQKVISVSGLDRLGRHELLFAFSFAKALLLRTVLVVVVPRGSKSIAQEQAQADQNAFVPSDQKRNPADAHRIAQRLDHAVVVPGERPTGEVRADGLYTRRLPPFDLPRSLPPREAYLRAIQPRLSIETYKSRFTALLQLEEIQMWADITLYDRQAALSTTSQRQGLLRLQVDGLAESRPSVQKGDAILASLAPIGPNSRPRGVFEGFVHHVEREFVFLKFHADFHRAHVSGQKYFIRFKFNRIPIRRMLMGIVDLAATGAQARLFPATATSSSSSSKSISSSSAFASASSSSAPSFTGPTLLVTSSASECDAWVDREVFSKPVFMVGLDTESAMAFGQSNELAIIQIATRTSVLVYRHFGSRALPARLVLLLDSGILKFSVGVEDDLLGLIDLSPASAGMINLQDANVGGRLKNGQLKGTQALADEYCPTLGFDKSKPMQTSDWSRWPLTPGQQEYAANDALIALAIGTKIFAPKMGQPAHLPNSLIRYVASPMSSASASSSPSLALPVLGFVSKKLNDIQRRAVAQIVHGAYHPKPHLLFGPPGTGKTTVLVEAIQQLLKQSTSTVPIRILAVAPSNSAADLFVERLTNLNKADLLRLNAISRSVAETPLVVKGYSSVVGDTFTLIPRESVLKFRVVVSTAMSAACLAGVGCRPGDFTHIVCDEAGHATEPELVAALGGLIDPKLTRVILGGDPQQLGPVVRSTDAIKGGLGVSLLERLMQPYVGPGSDGQGGGPSPASDADGRYMTKLLHNYRSHPAILHTPNELFYSSELIAAADLLERRSLCKWPSFPAADFPLLFHHIVGKEQRVESSPSWQNLDECVLVCEYVEQLLAFKQAGLTPKDIGVISPYHRQVTQIRSSLHTRFERMGRADEWRDLKVGSCEEFQGQERRVILMSTVRSQLLSLESFDVKFQLGFVHQPKRMNVALTRAKQALIIVGNGQVLQTDANWRRVLMHCQTNGAVRGEFKVTAGSGGTLAASSSSSSSSVGSSSDPDRELFAGLAQLISLKQDAESAAARRADEQAGALEGELDADGWQMVPTSGQPWKTIE